ncbi:hypothetical protein NC653_022812 [Populus alba x Populus x berolinensis]|uniref:Uncharacterized protein n=1 Tax=Populus alba x Populus x berolinensis TaxID=444605 RepID=A0AAD6MHZ6_9ROSI|nr:hypothetical protein NC653_022812 [Populus alba x Populus x berolinensis]
MVRLSIALIALLAHPFEPWRAGFFGCCVLSFLCTGCDGIRRRLEVAGQALAWLGVGLFYSGRVCCLRENDPGL